MNKAQLVEAVAEASGLTKKDSAKAVEAVLASISTALGKKEEVTFVGFGRFKPSLRAARDGRNPKTGEKIKIPARTIVRFTSSKELQTTINK
jgi:DNA-binding protein HU-beta